MMADIASEKIILLNLQHWNDYIELIEWFVL